MWKLPFLNVLTSDDTYPTVPHSDKNVVRANCRHVDLCDPYISWPKINRCFHLNRTVFSCLLVICSLGILQERDQDARVTSCEFFDSEKHILNLTSKPENH